MNDGLLAHISKKCFTVKSSIPVSTYWRLKPTRLLIVQRVIKLQWRGLAVEVAENFSWWPNAFQLIPTEIVVKYPHSHKIKWKMSVDTSNSLWTGEKYHKDPLRGIRYPQSRGSEYVVCTKIANPLANDSS